MNRSQRSAAVIGKSIVAGLLCAGFGLAAAALAVADVRDGTGGADASNNNGTGRGDAAVSESAAGAVSTRPRRGVLTRPSMGENGWHPDRDWCHIVSLAWPIDPPLPYTGNRNGIIAQLLPAPTRAAIISGIADAGQHASTAPAVEPPEAPPPPAEPPPAATASSAAEAQAPAVFPAAAPAPPAAQQEAVPTPESVAPEPNRVPVRLPELPSTDLGQIAAVALPGLAGIAALTALGGFLGYRQARAGYVLRATGTARFLQ